MTIKTNSYKSVSLHMILESVKLELGKFRDEDIAEYPLVLLRVSGFIND